MKAHEDDKRIWEVVHSYYDAYNNENKYVRL